MQHHLIAAAGQEATAHTEAAPGLSDNHNPCAGAPPPPPPPAGTTGPEAQVNHESVDSDTERQLPLSLIWQTNCLHAALIKHSNSIEAMQGTTQGDSRQMHNLTHKPENDPLCLIHHVAMNDNCIGNWNPMSSPPSPGHQEDNACNHSSCPIQKH